MKAPKTLMYKVKFHIYFIILLSLFSATDLSANDIQIKNVRLSGQVNDSYTFVNFDLSWKNSWRNTTNWDAAWVFVKYKIGSGEWLHATLSSTSTDHTAPTGSTISPSSDGKGVFIYRNTNGTGDNNFAGTALRWLYSTDGVANDAQVTVKVFAIEMVYIPEGSFYLGDGASDYRFHEVGNTSNPFQITSENALLIDDTTPGSLTALGNMGTGTIPAEFPKGYKAFYIMKYEITQGQYAEFLNMLTSTQATNRFNPSEMFGDRFTITGTYPLITTNRAPRACNYLAYVDGAAYADWAALRPYTEFELEKVCRGTAFPVAGEYAWGNTNIDLTGGLSGVENGTETVTDGLNVNHGNLVDLSNGDGGRGPIRVGIFAATINTREGSGGSFYGVMEMTGNVWETVVSSGLSDSRTFQGTQGDGILSSNGNATNSDWAGYSDGEVVSNYGSGGRAGGWQNYPERLRVSDRFYSNSGALREPGNGFRCARTAD